MKLKIETNNIKEIELIEGCLNLACSGLEYKHILSFYALANHWNIDKLIYYINLIEKEGKWNE